MNERSRLRTSENSANVCSVKDFVKIYNEILESSIWEEDSDTVRVWFTLLIKCDYDGFYRATIGALARTANVSKSACQRAMAIFMAPDPDSGSEEHEGRRIIPHTRNGVKGYMVVNAVKYRERRSPAAERMARVRAERARTNVPDRDQDQEREKEGEEEPLVVETSRARAIVGPGDSSSSPSQFDSDAPPEPDPPHCPEAESKTQHGGPHGAPVGLSKEQSRVVSDALWQSVEPAPSPFVGMQARYLTAAGFLSALDTHRRTLRGPDGKQPPTWSGLDGRKVEEVANAIEEVGLDRCKELVESAAQRMWDGKIERNWFVRLWAGDAWRRELDFLEKRGKHEEVHW